MNPLTEKAFQHGHLLTTQQNSYREWVVSFLTAQLQEDKKNVDLTSDALYPDPNQVMTAEIICKEGGIMAGLEELKLLCELQGIKFTIRAMDGFPIKPKETIAELTGPVGKLLETERVGLDLIGRMSGIATGTRALIERIAKTSPVPIAATRKTLWGALDKKGVYLGGGFTHRLGLWQAILVKENHLIGLENRGEPDPFKEAIYRCLPLMRRGETAFFEIEVESIKDALRVGELFSQYLFSHAIPPLVPLAILLDNFSPPEITETVQAIREKGWTGKILLEASGGINRENIVAYAKTGVDLLSLGMLTHSARNLDFSQRMLASTVARTRHE